MVEALKKRITCDKKEHNFEGFIFMFVFLFGWFCIRKLIFFWKRQFNVLGFAPHDITSFATQNSTMEFKETSKGQNFTTLKHTFSSYYTEERFGHSYSTHYAPMATSISMNSENVLSCTTIWSTHMTWVFSVLLALSRLLQFLESKSNGCVVCRKLHE